ncbi:exported hypothetical protein [Desulfamplus magnetovallimortis]|uniref:Dockerin domain-containing protein n=1 Tax=Desulfamplus magnetovallimortis TaxID=1246637 RepID=A0A1W1HAW4_9BACT|nr:dockerin type I domain-containing protein [Desulfamplus magnetovallimortis]SLM29518.1 exported hypothetical protein [Desulfamplus magnetovallimortis]
MKNIMKRSILSLVFLMVAGTAFAQTYELQFIQPDTGYESTRAYGINNSGKVVGRMDDSSGKIQAFVWDGTTLNRLPPISDATKSSTWHINDEGLVSGYSTDADNNKHAIIWDSETGSLVDIHDGNVTGDSSSAYGMDDSGRVVGMADIPETSLGYVFHAFLYDTVSGFQDLGTLNNSGAYGNGYSIAYSINNYGDVVGIAHDSSWNYRPFIYSSTDGMVALEINTSLSSGEWYATVINDSCLIGGHVISATNKSLPYIWSGSTAVPAPVIMTAAFPYGEIYGINSDGSMVGAMWDSDADEPLYHAFILEADGSLSDLNDMIPAGSGAVLEFARYINEIGQIVGYGTENGIKRGFVLTPSGTPPLMPGDANLDNIVNILDITTCINHITGINDLTGDGFINADMNSDSTLDILDVISIINAILGT